MDLGKEVLRLKKRNKSPTEIAKILKCRVSSVSYHYDPEQKKAQQVSKRKWKAANVLHVKIMSFKYARKSISAKKDDPKLTIANLRKKIVLNPKCYLTGSPIDLNDPKAYSLDHIIPTCKGGENTLKNCGLASTKANQLKNDLTYKELLEACKMIIKNKKNNYLIIN